MLGQQILLLLRLNRSLSWSRHPCRHLHPDCMLCTVLPGIAAAQQLPMRLDCSDAHRFLCDWGNCWSHFNTLLSWLTCPCCAPLLELHGGRYSFLERLGAVSLARPAGLSPPALMHWAALAAAAGQTLAVEALDLCSRLLQLLGWLNAPLSLQGMALSLSPATPFLLESFSSEHFGDNIFSTWQQVASIEM